MKREAIVLLLIFLYGLLEAKIFEKRRGDVFERVVEDVFEGELKKDGNDLIALYMARSELKIIYNLQNGELTFFRNDFNLKLFQDELLAAEEDEKLFQQIRGKIDTIYPYCELINQLENFGRLNRENELVLVTVAYLLSRLKRDSFSAQLEMVGFSSKKIGNNGRLHNPLLDPTCERKLDVCLSVGNGWYDLCLKSCDEETRSNLNYWRECRKQCCGNLIDFNDNCLKSYWQCKTPQQK